MSKSTAVCLYITLPPANKTATLVIFFHFARKLTPTNYVIRRLICAGNSVPSLDTRPTETDCSVGPLPPHARTRLSDTGFLFAHAPSVSSSNNVQALTAGYIPPTDYINPHYNKHCVTYCKIQQFNVFFSVIISINTCIYVSACFLAKSNSDRLMQ